MRPDLGAHAGVTVTIGASYMRTRSVPNRFRTIGRARRFIARTDAMHHDDAAQRSRDYAPAVGRIKSADPTELEAYSAAARANSNQAYARTVIEIANS